MGQSSLNKRDFYYGALFTLLLKSINQPRLALIESDEDHFLYRLDTDTGAGRFVLMMKHATTPNNKRSEVLNWQLNLTENDKRKLQRFLRTEQVKMAMLCGMENVPDKSLQDSEVIIFENDELMQMLRADKAQFVISLKPRARYFIVDKRGLNIEIPHNRLDTLFSGMKVDFNRSYKLEEAKLICENSPAQLFIDGYPTDVCFSWNQFLVELCQCLKEIDKNKFCDICNSRESQQNHVIGRCDDFDNYLPIDGSPFCIRSGVKSEIIIKQAQLLASNFGMENDIQITLKKVRINEGN